MDNNHLAGTFFGAISGIYTSLMTSNLIYPSKEAIIQTAILAAIGGVVGWISVGIAKFIKENLSKVFKKNDKTGN